MSENRKGKPGTTKGKKIWLDKPHPRGFLGKHHTVASRTAISSTQAGRKPPPEAVLIRLKSRCVSQGTLSPRHKRGSWKSGWRTIGGKRIYARSKWEANYARYLQLLKEKGQIRDWDHEVKTFWFEKIKRGVRSYLPDFLVVANDTTEAYHEVKGWMDSRSLTKARRMKKYYPMVKIILIQGDWFKANNIKLSGLITEWER